MADSSLRLRPWAFLMLFMSAYAPLMVIMAIKQIDLEKPYFFTSIWLGFGFLGVAIFSSIMALLAVKNVKSGLTVTISKASNKSGDMFGYTIPYMLSFMKIDVSEWQTVLAIALFLTVLFIMSYRTQTVFINPVLAIFGYMLIDCTFKRDDKETQAMVITKKAICAGDSICLDKLSHYLYIRSHSDYSKNKDLS